MFAALNDAISSFVWGVPMLVIFLGTGLFLSLKTRFYQIFGVKDWLSDTVVSAFSQRKKSKTDGSISPFSALASSLAACLGTGNIVGVATALCSGGAGSVFWMCISAVLGMMTCCCEIVLGVRFREKSPLGQWRGGPMYYIEKGLGMKGLACTYAVFLIGASLGMGNMTQANSVSQGLSGFGVPAVVSGIITAVLILISVSGGLKRISSVSEKLIPVLSVAFVAACMIIILKNYKNIFPCFEYAVKEAFTLRAVSGFGMAKAMRYGVSRGVFSNEAGLGSCAIIHSAAHCDSAAQQGKWGILEVFIDTVLMCTLTAAAILTSGVWSPDTRLNGVELCSAVFESVFGRAGGVFLDSCICLFAFATLMAWSYYGKSGAEYLFGEKGARIYNIVYVAAAFIGSVIRLESVWSLSDTLNGLMAVPNIFAVLMLSKTAAGEIFTKPDRLHCGGKRLG